MERIDHYVVLEELGRGGMGVVYRAHDPQLKRDVALKVILHPELLDPTELARFRTEAQVMARLKHPHLVQVLGAGATPRGPYLVLELVAGESLAQRLKRVGRLTPSEAVRLVEQVARGLGHAHAQGIVHRDVKPENVLIDRAGEARLTDFGIAKAGDLAQGLTQTGEVLGTPSYMAPEAARGDRAQVGPASDVYGLGATLFHALSGEPPVQGSSVLEVLDRVVTQPTPRLRSVRPQLDAGLDAICAEAMAKEPEERPPNARALADRLTIWLAASGEGAGGVAARSAAPLVGAIGLLGGAALGLLAGVVGLAPTPSAPTAPPTPPPAAPVVSTPPVASAPGHEAAVAGLIREAERLAEENQAALALRLLKLTEPLAPEHAGLHAARGFAVWIHNGDDDGKRDRGAHFARAARLAPGSAWDLLRRAWAEQDPHAGAALAARAAEQERKRAWVQFAAAGCHKFHGATAAEQDRGTWLLDEAIELNPRFVAARIWRSEIWQRRGKFANALEDADAAVLADPLGRRCFMRRGALELAWARQLDGAKRRDRAQRGIRDYRWAAENAKLLGLWEEWVDAFTSEQRLRGFRLELLKVVPPQQGARLRREAVQRTRRALARPEVRGHPELSYLLGELCYGLNDLEAAIQAYSDCLAHPQVRPERRFEALMQRARSHATLAVQHGWAPDRLERARKDYQAAVKARPRDDRAQDRVLEAWVRLFGLTAADRPGGTVEERCRWGLEQLADRFAKGAAAPRLWGLQGELHERLGDRRAAWESYRQVLKDAPKGSRLHEQVSARLKRLSEQLKRRKRAPRRVR